MEDPALRVGGEERGGSIGKRDIFPGRGIPDLTRTLTDLEILVFLRVLGKKWADLDEDARSKGKQPMQR